RDTSRGRTRRPQPLLSGGGAVTPSGPSLPSSLQPREPPVLPRPRRRLKRAIAAALLLALPAPALGVQATPDPKGLPGQEKLQQLLNGLYSWSLIISLAALVISALVWALGAHQSHYAAAASGKRGVLVAALAALLIGMAPAIVNFFYALGRA